VASQCVGYQIRDRRQRLGVVFDNEYDSVL